MRYRPNGDTGFYQAINADGGWAQETLSLAIPSPPAGKLLRVLQDEGIKKPFVSIFIWTIVFSVMTVILTVAVGMVLACVVQWEALKARRSTACC